MVNRVDLQKLVDMFLNQERAVRKKGIQDIHKEGVKVDLSQLARSREQTDLSELENKVSRIREKLERGEYQVSAEKILEGLIKFLGSFEK